MGYKYNPLNNSFSSNEASELDHSHSNKTILDNTTAEYTSAEKTKLGNLNSNFLGAYANLEAMQVQHPTTENGQYFMNDDTDSLWYKNDGTWANSGTSSAGDMIRSVYDPQNIAKDTFNRANHTGSQSISTITNLSGASVDANGTINIPNGLVIEKDNYLYSKDSSNVNTDLLGMAIDGSVRLKTANGGTCYINPDQTSQTRLNTNNPEPVIVENSNFIVEGFTKLGSDAPAIKQKLFTGTFSALANTTTSVLIGLPTNKIIGIQLLSVNSNNDLAPDQYMDITDGNWFKFWYSNSDTRLFVTTGSNPILIGGQTFKALITYEE